MLKKTNERGITLISLVITIVILLILAGVAINLAVDSDGLFGKAGEAGNEWNSSIAEESTVLGELLGTLDKISPSPVSLSTELPEEWDETKVTQVALAGNRKAPIPKGYVASSVEGENTIARGLVIYEKTASITEVNSGNHDTALTSCNQFVWIPVDDIDYMVMCKSNNKLADEEGNKTCDLEVVNGALQCTNPAHTETATDLCGRVYATITPENDPVTVDGKSVYTRTMTFTAEERATQVWDTSSYREPDIVSTYDTDSNTSYLTAAGVSSASELEAQLTSDFRAMAESVEKYGGFYVARYEAGANGASKKNQEVMVAGTFATGISGVTAGTYIAEDNMWYGLYNKLKTSSGINKEAVVSHMIWGCQYDQVISFLAEDTTNDPFTGHTGRQLNAQAKTGSNPNDEMSNVYDLEGNHREWTAQAYSTNGRGFRCGNFYSVAVYSECYPASYRGSNYPGDKGCLNSSRSTLYL